MPDCMGSGREHVPNIPMIHGPDGSKLSKRHGALGVRGPNPRDGYMLPAELRNILVRTRLEPWRTRKSSSD